MESIEKNREFLNASFQWTFVFMVFAFLFTMVSRSLIQNTTFRKILFWECIITLVSFSIYGFFNIQLETLPAFKTSSLKLHPGKKITSDEINTIRYVGWSITTPLMLCVLCYVLAYHLKLEVKSHILWSVILLDYVMLLFGLLGEFGYMSLLQAMVLGFIPFFIMFYIIYRAFVHKRKSSYNLFVFWVYFVLWTGYGLVYVLDAEYKTMLTNLLDALAKGVFAIGISSQFLL
jgi:bacteriorhodopsin